MSPTRRFLPDPAEARRGNMITVLLVAVLTPLIGWAEGIEDPWVLVIATLGMGALTFAFYSWLDRSQGGATIAVGPEELVIERRGVTVALPWSDIASIRFGSYGGTHMAIKRRSARGALRFRLDDHSVEAVQEMRRLFEARIGA